MSIFQGLYQYNASLYAAWKGKVGNDQLYYNAFDGSNWVDSNPSTIPVSAVEPLFPAGSSIGPALAAANGLLYAAWKGKGIDQNLYYASFNGNNWSGQTQIQLLQSSTLVPAISSIGPSLAAIGNNLFAAWAGANNDLSLSFASLNTATSTWPVLPQITGAASSIGPALAAIGNTLYAAWTDAVTGANPSGGQLYYASLDTSKLNSSWVGPTLVVLPNSTPTSSVGPAIAAIGNMLYWAWKAAGNDQSLWYASLDTSNSTWTGQAQISNFASSIGPALAVFGPTPTLYAMWKGENDDERLWYASLDPSTSTWTPQARVPGHTGQDMVPPPILGLGSFSNYILYSNCNTLTNLFVTIDVTQDIVSSNGFSFQLNTYSPAGANCIWQQYGIMLDMTRTPPELRGFVETWPWASYATSANIPGDLINDFFDLLPMPSGKLPAGWQLTISLEEDANGNIIGAMFVVVDNFGVTQANQMVVLQTLDIDGVSPPEPVTPAVLAPIVAFELNLVGMDNSATAQLTSGAGTITYTASSALTPLSQLPTCTAYGGGTAETSNSFHGMLPPSPSNTITQPFGVNAAANSIATGQTNTSSTNTNTGPSPGAILTAATVTFSNISSGKDSSLNYWLYLFPGGVSGVNNAAANFAENSFLGYNQNQPVPNNLSITTVASTFSDFAPQAGGSLLIALNGNFGGLHQNSDWRTGIILNLTFQGTSFSITWPVIDLHADESNPSQNYTFNFVWNSSANTFVAQ
jgi:hypothetical protein